MLNGPDPRAGDEGLTLVEMVIVLLLTSIVLISALSALTSLANAAVANNTVVTRQQTASTVVAQLERDIRSASAISIPTNAFPAYQLQLTVPSSGGTTTGLLWVYDPTAGTLTRETEANGVFQPNGLSTADVSNGSATAVFTYYGADGNDISSTSSSNISLCTTAVGVDVKITSPAAGGGSYQESSEVALTDQAQTLTNPGDGQCGSA